MRFEGAPVSLEDLTEEIVLETKASKITPLVTNPGLVLLTSLRLYFQPFNNVEPTSELCQCHVMPTVSTVLPTVPL
ncbi:neutral sphingomyelinase (N-smase) activation associated factor fan, putative [Ixodes scapularis]|uniref:Neutral sphingomyelinase (N-smase) activation associated factor fan, putative n=1 Tax=Ixodes scapularis TaxID=6945 RepID=B7QDY9_IXOSC|nr:neutral sphingomyelinase (N-smase) activation associated factor fan, putative [Ixodes scapularis]|eukprot:XP_002413753.1 neutral sphingomyelinase (N-smase) activation associated factor fan, putative [Ixodes scapularis]